MFSAVCTMENPMRKSNLISRAGLDYCSISNAYSYMLSNIEKNNDNSIE